MLCVRSYLLPVSKPLALNARRNTDVPDYFNGRNVNHCDMKLSPLDGLCREGRYV